MTATKIKEESTKQTKKEIEANRDLPLPLVFPFVAYSLFIVSHAFAFFADFHDNRIAAASNTAKATNAYDASPG